MFGLSGDALDTWALRELAGDYFIHTPYLADGSTSGTWASIHDVSGRKLLMASTVDGWFTDEPGRFVAAWVTAQTATDGIDLSVAFN